MSVRSQFCEFDKETRKYIKKRDNNRCIFCGNNGSLQIAHIFLSRSHGGKGCKENGVMLCIKCHQALDNGKDVSLRDQISQFCRAYLIKKENIIDLSSLMYTLKYDKKNSLRERVRISKEKNFKWTSRFKTNNGTIREFDVWEKMRHSGNWYKT